MSDNKDKYALLPEKGVAMSTHAGGLENPAATAPTALAPDLFGSSSEVPAIQGKPAGNRAGRPNRLSRIMAAKIENEHGTTVLQAMTRQALSSLPELAKEAISAAKEIAQETGQEWREILGDAAKITNLRRYRLDCLATAAPYLHAKRAPEDNKGNSQPVIFAFSGVNAADLRRKDDALGDDEMLIDMNYLIEQNQYVSANGQDAAETTKDDNKENVNVSEL